MPGNAKLLQSEPALAWLGQFDPADQPTAQILLEAMKLVSRDEFAERLRELVLERLNDGSEPVGLYAEREVRKRLGVPNRLFKQTRTKVKRAYGVGPRPVDPTKAYDPDVGSEGLIAHLVSELCREQPKRFFSHPGPDKIRREKIRRFILVTDFIGSGQRAAAYIEAAWRVRSVRSWWSAKPSNGLKFEVIAYAATPSGRAHVEAHPSQPSVHVATGCPTIGTAFPWEIRKQVRDLCIRMDPGNHDFVEALGYHGSGALIAFAHGVPNNAPRILHKRSVSWEPLFPVRVTSATRHHFPSNGDDLETVRARLVRLRQSRLAKGTWLEKAKPHARATLLVLAALARPPRQEEAISRQTGLAMLEVRREIARALAEGWIDGRWRLTDRGQAELAAARAQEIVEEHLQPDQELVYFPESLRAPMKPSS